MPFLRPVLRPRCWSGKKRTFSPRSRQSYTLAALEDVQTMPPFSQKALRAAAEFMYVTGTMPVMPFGEFVPAGVDVFGVCHVGH